MNWKKRGRKGWLGSKTAKEVSKGRERQYANKDIKQQLQEDFEGDDFRYNGGKRKRNRKAQIENWISYYQRRLLEEDLKQERARAKGERYIDCGWFGPSYYRSRIEEYQKELKKIEENS